MVPFWFHFGHQNRQKTIKNGSISTSIFDSKMTSKMTPKMTPKSIRIDPGAQQVISQKPMFFSTKPHILSFGHPPWTPKRRPRNTLRIRLDFLTILGSKNDSKMTPGRPKRQPRNALKIRLDFLTILSSQNDPKWLQKCHQNGNKNITKIKQKCYRFFMPFGPQNEAQKVPGGVLDLA